MVEGSGVIHVTLPFQSIFYIRATRLTPSRQFIQKSDKVCEAFAPLIREDAGSSNFVHFSFSIMKSHKASGCIFLCKVRQSIFYLVAQCVLRRRRYLAWRRFLASQRNNDSRANEPFHHRLRQQQLSRSQPSLLHPDILQGRRLTGSHIDACLDFASDYKPLVSWLKAHRDAFVSRGA